MSNRVVYDAAVLVAADRNDRRIWSDHKVRLQKGLTLLVPSPVVAQVSRSAQQVQLRRFLTGCEIVPLDERDAHEAGRLIGKAGTADVVDAAVMVVALQHDAIILTGDAADLQRLAAASGRAVTVESL